MPRRSINGHSRKRKSAAFKKKNSGMSKAAIVGVSTVSPAAGVALLAREHKRKKAAKWYSDGGSEDQWSAQEEELGNLASTGVTIPPDEAI